MLLSLLRGPYQNVLICGISTQVHELQPDWDELIQNSDSDFPATGLHRTSAVWLSYLYAADATEIVGPIGRINPARLRRLTERLARQIHA